MRSRAQRAAVAAFALVVLATLGVVASATTAAPGGGGPDPAAVETASDPGKAKLDDALRARVESGATGEVAVFVTVAGRAARVRTLLDDDAAARAAGKAIVVGRIGTQAVPKLASLKHVVSVGLVQLKQTGRPLGDPDPLAGRRRPSRTARSAALDRLAQREVPYDRAPKLKGSNFEELKRLGVLDARTHNFADAWRDGYAGEGVTVGVLDGGTDFGHPDLIGTWQTWSGATDTATVDDGWNGWPKAFDPFGTLVWLAAPGNVDEGLSWYTKTTAATCRRHGNECRVEFATRTGPSRSTGVPSGTATHTYTFPRRWSESGTVRLGSHPDDYLLDTYEERPAFLVVDARRAGDYDTVYVDLDDDHSFSDEKPVTKGSPSSYRDLNGDGYTDLSGGLLYYISDGETRIPGGLTSFLGPDTPAPGPGELLAWSGDYDMGIEGHGTLTASNVVGQGVINGKAPRFEDLPRDGRVPGAVIGGSPHAKLAPYGDIYFSFDFSTQFGYLLSTQRGIDVTSNSYGSSDVDNDGYDAASQEADILHDGSRTTPLFSTGNGAPGFGTISPPSPSAGISVGASTQFGGTGWDSIGRIRQVVDDDVITWSNRGPGATGDPGPDVVADGAYSSGDLTLNTVLDGRNAWETWGGTSRSAPVAASATALVYQAYKRAHGGAVPAGFSHTARGILKSSAEDLGYDAFTQGAGSVDAGRAVRAAAGRGATVAPDEWRVGDYRGEEHQVFTHVIAPGASDTQTFTVGGSGGWSVSDRSLRRTDSEQFPVTTSAVGNESAFNFNAPDYLVDITDRVRRHRDADLMVVRAIYPHDQFDGDGDYEVDQQWRLLTYNWTDANRDRNLWTDRDRDGAVDHADRSTSSNIDGNLDIDFARSEMDRGEYVRFSYHRPDGNELMTFVRDPGRRMDDGIFVGLQHTTPNAAIPRTAFTIQIDYYSNEDWPWLTTPAQASGSFDATLRVPDGTPFGMYDGAIVLRRDRESMVVPVSVAVAAQAQQDASGKLTGALQFGGADVAQAQRNLRYNNGSVFGATDWSWRAESGDWRFFFYDVATAPPEGTQFLADTTWEDTAPYTDLDTLVFGRSANSYQLLDGSDPFGGPYVLDTVGKSENTNSGAGVWRFDTATGGAHEVIAAPAQEGLHALVQHQVGWDGGKFDVPFSTKLGSVSVTPSAVEQTATADSGSFDVTVESSIDLDGLAAEGFGLSQPTTTQEPVAQDDPDDPSTASVKRDVTIDHASRLTVTTELAANDVDLFVLRDANGDGQFTPDEIVASSAGATGDESVELVRPADGAYQVWIHGFQVSGTPSATLTIDPVQGNDLTVSGVPDAPIPAGTPVTLHVDYAKAMLAGQTYFGELLLGPTAAPTALSVPIAITRSGP